MRRNGITWRIGCGLAVSLSACGSDGDQGTKDAAVVVVTHGDAGSGSPDGGAASIDGGRDAASGGSDGSGGGQDARVDPDALVSIALYNVVRAEPLAKFRPLPDVLNRVELPPRVTVSAEVEPQIGSVRFFVDDTEARLDTAPPFVLSETDAGAPSAWSITTPGAHTIEARAYDNDRGEGTPADIATWTFTYTRTGLDADFTPLSDSANQSWVGSNLDDVMEARTFTGSMGSLPYRIFVPPDYDASVHYPLLVFLHGRGVRGTDNRREVYQWTKLFAGSRSIVSPNMRDQFPAIVIAPQCSDVPDWQEWAHWVGNSQAQPFAGLGSDGSYTQAPDPWPSALHVRELVDALAEEFTLDTDRVYLTGESMGGFGTWEFTTRWPDVWAAGVPMAGFSDRSKVSRILKIPFWVFHGASDSSNPVAGSRAMTQALVDAGGEAKLTEYPGTEHVPTFERAWTMEPELLPWIFAQYKR